MEKLTTARDYARGLHGDTKEAVNLERRLQRRAADLPEEEKQMVGRYYALSPSKWAELAALEVPMGRPKGSGLKGNPGPTPQ